MSWKLTNLGTLIDVLSGFAFDSKKFSDSSGKPLIRIRDIKRSYTETYYNGNFEEKYVVKFGDVLIGMDGEFNVAEWNGTDALLNQRVCKVTVKDPNHLDLRYLLYFLPYELKLIEDKASFVTVKHLSVNDVKNIQIPLPPLATQKRIAEILDAADELRRKDQELLKKYNELAQAIFIDMFGDPVKNEKGWDVNKGRDVVKVLGGAAFKSIDYEDDGIPLIRIGTINKGYFDKSQIVFLPSNFAISHERYIVKPKDLLITLTGTVGKDDYGNVYVMEDHFDQYLLNQRVAKLIVNQDYLITRFFEFLLKQKEVKAELTDVSRGVRQANISNEDIYNLDVISPPMALQNDFVERINSVYGLMETSTNSSLVSDILFNSLIQKAFNGEPVS